MSMVTAFGNALEKMGQWGWRDDWHGPLVTPQGADEVYCPIKAADIGLATCRACERLVDIRSLSDAGATVKMVVCEREQAGSRAQ